jgi:hypothetical protein
MDSHTTSLGSAASTVSHPSFSGVEALRTRFISDGVSENAAKVMLASCRDSTHKQYESAWRAWVSWCDSRSLDPISAPVNKILYFLVECENRGLAYRSLGVYRSAISLYHRPINGKPVGEMLEVIRLMKGFFNRNPPRPKYTLTWDVEPVILFFAKYASLAKPVTEVINN